MSEDKEPYTTHSPALPYDKLCTLPKRVSDLCAALMNVHYYGQVKGEAFNVLVADLERAGNSIVQTAIECRRTGTKHLEHNCADEHEKERAENKKRIDKVFPKPDYAKY